METLLTLTKGQFDLVYNLFSLVIAGMGAALLFFVLQRDQIGKRHRLAVTLSSVVVAIALYHYWRIFGSWNDSFSYENGKYVSTGAGFNEGYRYVDWLLTVPLLLAELVIVLKLAAAATRDLLVKLSGAAVAMIVLGYPGEIASPDSTERIVWFVLSCIPFVYILWTLFVSLGKMLSDQSGRVLQLFSALRWVLVTTWMVYPLAYIAPMVIENAATAEVARQVGYSIADLLAKPLFGLLVFAIALAKTRADESGADHDTEHESVTAAA